jgi:hypothetical protein
MKVLIVLLTGIGVCYDNFFLLKLVKYINILVKHDMESMLLGINPGLCSFNFLSLKMLHGAYMT